MSKSGKPALFVELERAELEALRQHARAEGRTVRALVRDRLAPLLTIPRDCGTIVGDGRREASDG